MRITCPHCQFGKDVNEQWIPKGPSRVDCPECHKVFFYSHEGGVSLSRPKPPVPQITCPSCNLSQPQSDHCVGCGIVYAKWKRKQGGEMQFEVEPAGTRRRRSTSPLMRPKAGFWIRFLALFLDSLVVMVLSLVLFFVILGPDFLGFIAMMAQMQNGAMPFDPNDAALQQQMMADMQVFAQKAMLANLVATVLQLLYYVVPTGLWGKTLGKKICGIQVVRENGRVGLGWAFLREVIGKFISALLLGIGFLMVAFHKEKRGLHDLVAGTWVIKSR